MKVKVCGMREASNIGDLGKLEVDFIGFIFYNRSSRCVEQFPNIDIPKTIKRVGVFVNATIAEIEQKARFFNLDYIQLHGEESPEFCQQLKNRNYSLFKAFAVDDTFDFQRLESYENCCDYFLLDAKGASYGGNGIQFDWQVLDEYKSSKPFFLSGGIDLESIESVLNLKVPQLYGIDVNSKFEISPALKDVPKLKKLITQIK